MSNNKSILGVFTSFDSLSPTEQWLVRVTWSVAENAYIPRSNFPVGAVILAANDQGDTRSFAGCNVENRFFPATICAERNAATSAVADGYRKFLTIALVCKNYQGPGASPCGLCRQVLTEFGCEASVLSMADAQNNVFKFFVKDLLPAAASNPVPFCSLPAADKRLVRRLEKLLPKCHVPYSRAPRAAIFTAANASGKVRSFPGVSDDNASYGASALAECIAMRTAKVAGYVHNATLAVSVSEAQTRHNPVEGECLQVLREFGRSARVLLTGANRSVVYSSLEELLPDSFGPESLV